MFKELQSLDAGYFSLFGRDLIWQLRSGEIRYINNLDTFPAKEGEVYLARDHDIASKVWDRYFKLGIISAPCKLVHIDVHDDLYMPPVLPSSFLDLTQTKYQVGSFILPRAHLGLISEIIWVRPPRVTQRGTGVKSYPQSINSNDLQHRPSVIEFDSIPTVSTDILDIDLDFFTNMYGDAVPNWMFTMLVKRNLEIIRKRITNFKVITIASSPGFVSSKRERALVVLAIQALSSW